ncbi:unnamed protein product [Rotaria socialis]|uniref:Helitron helicase-like domain-containing protein n=1 Tax=Rotaria socialis TaxID=392032 RepID=A0A818S2F9_9BILA|nr:unnamed protein product [Rotaria socialis]
MTEPANARCLRDNMITTNAVLNYVSPYANCFRKLRDIYDKELSNTRITGSSMKKISLIFTRNLHDDQRVYNAPRTANDIAFVYVADRDGNIPAELDFAVQPKHQKRGLPHAHCLFTLSDEDKIKTADDVDNIISAELPDRNVQSELYNIIITQNIHGPYGRLNPKSIYGYPIYRRRNNSNETHFTRNKIQVDNRFVVPYNSFLSLKYNAGINVELCSTVKDIKYINNYITKGYDCARIGVQVNANDNLEKVVDYDEIKQYFNCRYMSSQEAAWHLQDFPIHGQSHNVVMLSIHLKDGQSIFSEENQAENALRREDVDLYHLRLIFLLVKGPDATSFENLKKFNGQTYSTYKDVARVRGLINDSNVWHNCMYEASRYMMPKCLQSLLVTIICHCNPANPLQLFEDFKENMIEDFIQQGNSVEKSLKVCINDIKMEIHQNGFDFNQFLSFPNFEDISDRENNLVNCIVDDNNLLWNDLNSDQILAADTILKSLVGLNWQKYFY